MGIALLSVGLLGLLLFALGLNVSRVRRSVATTQHEAEADPKSDLRKAIRAHGNCTEYVPMLALMILAVGLRTPLTPMWLAITMVAAVLFRYVHAAGILFGGSVYSANAMKFTGALGTYATGLILSIYLIYRSFLLIS